MKKLTVCLQHPTCPRDVIFMGTARCNCYAGCGLLNLMFAVGRKGIMKAGIQKCSQIDGDSRGLGSVSWIRVIQKLVGTTIFSNGVCRSQRLWLWILSCHFSATLPVLLGFHIIHISKKIKKGINPESEPLPLFLTFTAVDSTINQFLLYIDYAKFVSLYVLRNRKEEKNPTNNRPNEAGFPFLPWWSDHHHIKCLFGCGCSYKLF